MPACPYSLGEQNEVEQWMYNNNGLVLPFFPGYWMGAVSSAATWPQFRSIDPFASSPSATSYTHWGEAPS